MRLDRSTRFFLVLCFTKLFGLRKSEVILWLRLCFVLFLEEGKDRNYFDFCQYNCVFSNLVTRPLSHLSDGSIAWQEGKIGGMTTVADHIHLFAYLPATSHKPTYYATPFQFLQ